MLRHNEIIPMLTIHDVARLLNIHINTARRWSDQGIIKSYRITRRGDRRFRHEDIARFLAEYNDFSMKQPAEKEASLDHTNNDEIIETASEVLFARR
jgi:excisionase family DNA binding protein